MRNYSTGGMSPDLRAAVRGVPGGVELSVFCQPKAARSALIGMHGGALKAKVNLVEPLGATDLRKEALIHGR